MLDSYTETKISIYFDNNNQMECDQVFNDGSFKTIICESKYEVFDYVRNAGYGYDFYMPI